MIPSSKSNAAASPAALFIYCLANDDDQSMFDMGQRLTKVAKNPYLRILELHLEKTIFDPASIQHSKFQNIHTVTVISHHAFYDPTTGIPIPLKERTIGGISVDIVTNCLLALLQRSPTIQTISFYGCEMGIAAPLPVSPLDEDTLPNKGESQSGSQEKVTPVLSLSRSKSSDEPLSPCSDVSTPRNAFEIDTLNTYAWLLRRNSSNGEQPASSIQDDALSQPSVWTCEIHPLHIECIKKLLTEYKSEYISTLVYITYELACKLFSFDASTQKREKSTQLNSLCIKGLNGVGFIHGEDGKLWSFPTKNHDDLLASMTKKGQGISEKRIPHQEQRFFNQCVLKRTDPHVIEYRLCKSSSDHIPSLYPPIPDP